MSTRRHRHLAAPLLGVALAVAAAGCSDSTSGTASAASGSPGSSSASATSSSSPTTPVAASSSPATTSAAQVPTGNAHVRFGQTSPVKLDDYTSGAIHPITLTISVRAGSINDLKNFQLDAQTKRSTPYYLGIQVTNTGPTAVDTSGFAGLLTVDDQAGDELNSLTLLGDFALCEGNIPDKLAPGASAHECDVYPAPQGARLASVSIDNGANGDTVEWS